MMKLPPKGVPIIAVMGRTGSGKSHFIGELTGDKSIAGDDLESVTQDVSWYEATVDGKKVILLDTPGMDDSNRSDSVVLELIAAWLAETYQHNILLSGVIYMHDISEERMSSSSLASLMIFEELCGKDFSKNMVFISNRWDKVKEEAGRKKLNQLKDDKFWGRAIERGASVHEYHGNETDAKSIVSEIVDFEPSSTVTEKLLVDEKMPLVKTPAGQVAEGEIVRQLDELQKKVERLENALERAQQDKNREVEESLRLEVEKYRAEQERLKSERERLNSFSIKHIGAIVLGVGAAVAGAVMLGPISGLIAGGMAAAAIMSLF